METLSDKLTLRTISNSAIDDIKDFIKQLKEEFTNLIGEETGDKKTSERWVNEIIDNRAGEKLI